MNHDRVRSILHGIVVLSALLLACPLFARQGEEGRLRLSTQFHLADVASRTESFSETPAAPDTEDAECDPDQPVPDAILKKAIPGVERISVGVAAILHFAAKRDLNFTRKSREPPEVHHRMP